MKVIEVNKAKKIDTLQGLRYISFFLIFIWHLNGYMGLKTASYASIAVTFFVLLSGFVSMLTLERHLEKMKDTNSLKKSICYAKEKISKIYKLYVITLILYIPLSFKNLVLEQNMNIGIYLLFFLLNLFLLEAWHYDKFNQISYSGWYLSILIFLNFITIPIYQCMKYFNKKNGVIRNICFIFLCFLGLFIYSKIVPNENLSFYYYVFPLYRIFEYSIGICLANIYLKTKDNEVKMDKKLFTLFEIGVVGIVIYLVTISKDILLGPLFSMINISCCTLLIAVFMYQKGLFSKILSWKPLVILGNISGEMYLIHNVIIAYVLGIASRILPHNIWTAVLMVILVFILTVIISYIVHFKMYKKIQKNLKTKFIHFLGIFKQKKLKCKQFTIISNNCFAGVFYRNNNLAYMSPTCGLFIMPKDYIQFIYHIKEYAKIEPIQIEIEESKYSNYLKSIDYKGTIGKLNDIEIMFLHYSDFQEAKSKWVRRMNRIYYDKIIYKFNDQNGCTYEELLKFEQFPAENKICFTAREYEGINSIVFHEFEKIGYVENDTKEKIFTKYINMYDYINERFGKEK